MLADAARLVSTFLLVQALLVSAGQAAEPSPATVLPRSATAAEIAGGAMYAVTEIPFAGPTCGPADIPARDVELAVRFRHESGSPAYAIHGFWDGDGKGGATGNVFKVRFCPTAAGRWFMEEVRSNDRSLAGQHQGKFVTVVPSGLKGFWTVDTASPGGRWYQRSNGSHAYIFGNTHYSFLSEQAAPGARAGSIAADIIAGAKFFNKLRFAINTDRYAHPTEKPFFDNTGYLTGDGDYCHRPNPAWFSRRVDLAVRTAFECDIIADLILNGPDTPQARSVLRAGQNGGDPAPFLRYVAARYGSYPNVWMCLANEWNIKSPSYKAEEIRRIGRILRSFLPYPTPVSVHGNTGPWTAALNTTPPWNDHVIIQHKIRTLGESADAIIRSYALGGSAMPVINDELGYEGAGDNFSRDETIEGHLGAFLGGGYGTTGSKPANKKGQYFWGAFDPAEHTAATHLAWLRQRIDRNVTFWKMKPVALSESIFAGADTRFRAMEWPGNECVLGTCAAAKGIKVNLPPGTWRAMRFDAIAMEERTLAEDASETFTFDAPDSRAALFHFKRF